MTACFSHFYDITLMPQLSHILIFSINFSLTLRVTIEMEENWFIFSITHVGLIFKWCLLILNISLKCDEAGYLRFKEFLVSKADFYLSKCTRLTHQNSEPQPLGEILEKS